MPFSLQVISTTGGTYSLSAGTPYSLEQASGLWMAPVRRLTEQGPYQDGDTDRGYRLDPRTATLALNFTATSGSALDTYRDTLLSIFRPSTSTPLKLRLTRDDGAVRQLDCYTVGPVDLPLTKEHKPGNLHRAVVQLRAADPGWYDPTPGTVTVSGTPGLAANWYTAGGLIGTANVMEYGQTPSLNQAWTYTGTLTEYTVVFRSSKPTAPGSMGPFPYAFAVQNTASPFLAGFGFRTFENGDTVPYAAYGSDVIYDTPYAPVTSSTVNYSVRMAQFGTTAIWVGTRQLVQLSYVGLEGTARRWRTNGTLGTASAWTSAIPLYAVYNRVLTDNEVNTLYAYMDQTRLDTFSYAVSVPYRGDLAEYPVITLTGPMTGPVITNTTQNT